MWRKRKAPSPVSTHTTDQHRKKKRKQKYFVISSDNESKDSHESSDLAEDEWPINCILDETESQYLIDWEGPWSPTWEPKEHANEIAVRTWEDKKQQRPQNVNRLSESTKSESSAPRAQGRNGEACHPPEPHSSRERSPLFVPVDTISETPQAQETSGAIDHPEPSPSQLPGPQVSRSERSGATIFKLKQPTPATPGVTDPFEYAESPIPAEYLLSGEFLHSTDISREASLTPNREDPRPDGLLASDTTGTYMPPKSAGLSANKDLLAVSVGSRTKAEIAETPPHPPSVPESQRLRSHPESNSADPQGSAKSFGYQPVYSTLVPRVRLPGDFPSGSAYSPILSKSVPGSITTRSVRSGIRSQESIHIPQARAASVITFKDMDDQKKEVRSLSETMEKYSHYEGATPREKLRSAYAQLTARASAGPSQNVDVSATPSSAGDIEPSAPPPVPEATAPLSVRVDKEPGSHTRTEAAPAIPEPVTGPTGLEPTQHPTVQTIQPSALTVSNAEQVLPGSVCLGPCEFAVPLPMDSRVKDDYERVVASESHSIREFLRISDPREESAENELERLEPKIRDVLKHLSNVATHPDLNINDHIKDSRSDLAKEAAWAEYSSAKFLFLAYVVEIASSRDIHIVILVDEEKTQDVVERYLKGKGLVYTRPREEMGIGTNQEVSMTRDCLSFGIQSSRNDGVMETYKRPSAIVALDSSFNAKNPSVEHMRTTYARNGSLLPVIRLIVASSSEHVELCFPNLAEIQQLRLVVYYTMQLRDLVGDLQDDALGVREDVEEILSSLLSDNFEYHWPLPLIEPLHIVSSKELGSLRIGGLNEANAGSAPPLRALSQKRGIEVEGTNEQVSKRFRPGVSQDASQFTDGSNVQSQTLDRDLQTLEKHLIQMRASHAAERESLRESLAAAESRLLEREKVLESLQHRYESRTKNLHQIRQERDRLVESNTASEQRIQRQKEEIGKLKDERTQLRHDLESARERLKTGGGTAAELESSQEEIRRLTKENAALQRKAEYESKQTEYTREQYQTASTAAAQSGNESRQLREENETLKRKVAADVSRLKELNMKNEESRHLARIAELETTLSNRDDLLRRKEEELREIRKNRPSTRSTSTQPRSPKWTAGNSRPTSPGINNNGSTFAGRGSALRFSSEMSL